MNTIDQLTKFGLTQKEAQVYIALLELGNAVVNQIQIKTGLNRSTIYVIISSLLKRGLVDISSNLGVTKYAAAEPKQLLQQAKYNLQKYILLKQNLYILLPELQRLHKGATFKPKVSIQTQNINLPNDLNIKIEEDTVNLSSDNNTIIKIQSQDMANTIKLLFKLANKGFSQQRC